VGLGGRRAAAASEGKESENGAVFSRLDPWNSGEPGRSEGERFLRRGRRGGRVAGVAVARIRQVAGEIVMEGGADGEDDAVEHQPQNDPPGATEVRNRPHPSQYTV
jgi:hypothetical protein